MDGEYSIKEYSLFEKAFRKVLKKYRNSFEDDYDTARQVILKRVLLVNGNGRLLPKTRAIEGLGDGIKHEIYKMRIYIEQTRSDIGRLIFLIDRDRKCIFFIDIYHKNERINHDKDIIIDAYAEYLTRSPVEAKPVLDELLPK